MRRKRDIVQSFPRDSGEILPELSRWMWLARRVIRLTVSARPCKN